jgi:hypothetical protein
MPSSISQHVTYYQRPGGAHCTVKVTTAGENLCPRLAETLFHIATRECHQPGLDGKPFQRNFVYEFANGLVFRLFDDGLDAQGNVLEFYVPPEFQANKEQVLSRIPRLLQMAGVDARSLRLLRELWGPL